jgi:hypothetical protein
MSTQTSTQTQTNTQTQALLTLLPSNFGTITNEKQDPIMTSKQTQPSKQQNQIKENISSVSDLASNAERRGQLLGEEQVCLCFVLFGFVVCLLFVCVCSCLFVFCLFDYFNLFYYFIFFQSLFSIP